MQDANKDVMIGVATDMMFDKSAIASDLINFPELGTVVGVMAKEYGKNLQGKSSTHIARAIETICYGVIVMLARSNPATPEVKEPNLEPSLN